jgi:RNA-directed DNA polymerase
VQQHWLLTHSFSGRALAVKRVTENKGRNTPGVDKVTWKTPAAKAKRDCVVVEAGLFAPSASEGFYSEEKWQDEAARHPRDEMPRHAALHLLALEPVAETTAELNSYGFRPERSTADAGGQCFISLAKKASAEWVLEADIQNCFDKISHDWMLANIPADKVILKKWLKAGYVYQSELLRASRVTS